MALYATENVPPKEMPFKDDMEGARKASRVTLDEYVRMVILNNNDLAVHYLDFKTTQETARGEEGAFEPEFVTSYQSGEDRVRYSQEDKSSVLFAQERDAASSDFSASVQMLTPTGTTLKVLHATRKYKDRTTHDDYDYTSNVGVEVTQPLLKGAGAAPVAQLRAALAESDEAYHLYRTEKQETVKRALMACWDLYGAMEKLKVRGESVRIARALFENNWKRAALGRMAETEVLLAEAGLNKRLAFETLAEQELDAARDRVRTFVSYAREEQPLAIDFSHADRLPALRAEYTGSMQRAFSYRPEYQVLRHRILKENIRLKFAENQRWPQVDLKGSYGLNGLGDSVGDAGENAFHDDYRTWSVGLYFSVPLMGGIQTRSQLSIAEMNKRKALLELKSLEVEVANTIHTLTGEVNSAFDQLVYLSKSCETNDRLLKMVLARFNAGRTNSDEVLNREEDAIEAKEDRLDGFVQLQKSMVELRAAEGRLLVQYVGDPGAGLVGDQVAHAE
ncbi:TolC family protein [Desulfoluna spongiiphila]|uniref:TolC family protein n=1 Tax=Desulfoluna spongiiphila TaxID=419481 RepID=UPI00125F2391|nr:TolC family protein [Desulfoluna spongiiphila]